MAIDVKKFNKLREKARDARDEETRARGALEELEKQLAEEFNCTVEEAETLLEELKEEEAAATAAYEKALAKFEEKWGTVLCPDQAN